MDIYKILRPDELAALLAGSFTGAPADLADGYIHLCTAEQLASTIALHFPAEEDLTIVAIDLSRLSPHLRWEPARDGQSFPHFYGVLEPAFIRAYQPLTRDIFGAVLVPG